MTEEAPRARGGPPVSSGCMFGTVARYDGCSRYGSRVRRRTPGTAPARYSSSAGAQSGSASRTTSSSSNSQRRCRNACSITASTSMLAGAASLLPARQVASEHRHLDQVRTGMVRCIDDGQIGQDQPVIDRAPRRRVHHDRVQIVARGGLDDDGTRLGARTPTRAGATRRGSAEGRSAGRRAGRRRTFRVSGRRTRSTTAPARAGGPAGSARRATTAPRPRLPGSPPGWTPPRGSGARAPAPVATTSSSVPRHCQPHMQVDSTVPSPSASSESSTMVEPRRISSLLSHPHVKTNKRTGASTATYSPLATVWRHPSTRGRGTPGRGSSSARTPCQLNVAFGIDEVREDVVGEARRAGSQRLDDVARGSAVIAARTARWRLAEVLEPTSARAPTRGSRAGPGSAR